MKKNLTQVLTKKAKLFFSWQKAASHLFIRCVVSHFLWSKEEFIVIKKLKKKTDSEWGHRILSPCWLWRKAHLTWVMLEQEKLAEVLAVQSLGANWMVESVWGSWASQPKEITQSLCRNRSLRRELQKKRGARRSTCRQPRPRRRRGRKG